MSLHNKETTLAICHLSHKIQNPLSNFKTLHNDKSCIYCLKGASEYSKHFTCINYFNFSTSSIK